MTVTTLTRRDYAFTAGDWRHRRPREIAQGAPGTALAAALAVGFLLIAPMSARADPFTYQVIDVPGSDVGSTGFFDLGINDFGEIVGDFTDAAGYHGFLYSGGKYTTINAPNATSTVASEINDRHQIVGQYGCGTGCAHGFVERGGIFTNVDVTGALPGSTIPYGINNLGWIVGIYADAQGIQHGFLDSFGHFRAIDVPGAPPGSTTSFSVNDLGQIVGTYFGSNGPRAFLETGGKYITIVVPGSNSSAVAFGAGINDFGQIVGTFVDSTGTVSGFLDTQGHFTRFDVPAAIETVPANLNNLDQIVGIYGQPVTFNNIAFLATPKFGSVLDRCVIPPLSARQCRNLLP